MAERGRAAGRWSTYALIGACAAAVALAGFLVGPSHGSSGGSERTVTAALGVVQSTVSGSGTVAAARQLDVDFASAGTLTHVYVHPGAHVAEGQLLAEVDPHDAQLALDTAEANLAAAEASGTSSNGGQRASAATASASASAAAVTTPTTPPNTTPAATTPAATTPTTTPQRTATTPARTTPKRSSSSGGGSGSGSSSGSGSGSGSTSTAASAASRAASIASAQAAVDQAEATLAATKLTAPITGVVAAVNAQAGEQVGGGGASAASSSSSSSGSGGSDGGGGGGGNGSNSSSSSSSSSGSSAFIVLANLDALNLVVPFSESDVGKLRVGQPATVTVNALPSDELAAHVVSIATLPTSNSGVVSYDVTFRLDQRAHGLKVGMTATAQVVVSQADDAVSVPSAAISRRGGGSTVTLVRGGRDVQQPVVTGVVGDSATQILSGLKAGDTVAIATPTATGLGSALGSGAAGGGRGRFGGGGFGGGGGGPAIVTRGGP